MFKEIYIKVLTALVNTVDLDAIPHPVEDQQAYKDYMWQLTIKLRLSAAVIANEAANHLNDLDGNGEILN